MLFLIVWYKIICMFLCFDNSFYDILFFVHFGIFITYFLIFFVNFLLSLIIIFMVFYTFFIIFLGKVLDKDFERSLCPAEDNHFAVTYL